MKNATATRTSNAGKAKAMRAGALGKRPQLLGSLLVLNLIIVILLISGMRGILA